MRTISSSFHENSLAGILARLTHGILRDAIERAQEKGSSTADASRSSADSVPKPAGWFDRLDTWFWKQEMKNREAFLAQSLDIFDLEQRMRCLERGDQWLGTSATDRS